VLAGADLTLRWVVVLVVLAIFMPALRSAGALALKSISL
jgi:hypothetical protein